MSFSKRTSWDRQSNALNQLTEQLKAADTDILDLTESNPTRCGFIYPPQIVSALSDPRNLVYAPDARGTAAARAAVGGFCGFDPQRSILTASTSESYGFLCKLLLDPGDHVLIPRPSYPLFQFLLELNDAAFDAYPLVYTDGAWRMDLQAMEQLITPRTKAVIVVNPNNPTGSYVKRDEWEALNALCRTHGLAIISDEVFFDYRLQEGDYVSLRESTDVPTFVLGGLSKGLGLPQMKLGWILAAGPDEAVHDALERLEIIADTYLSVNTPVQNALPGWFGCAPGIQAQILERIHTNWAALAGSGLDVLNAEGGWYAVLRLTHTDEEEFVLDLLRRHHVLAHPGYFFDFEEPGRLVLSLLPKTEQFAKIINILRSTV